jgi:septal ring factor EnvC (AmiA/AmiB activator)
VAYTSKLLIRTFTLASCLLAAGVYHTEALAQANARDAANAKQKREEVRKKLEDVRRAMNQTSSERSKARKALDMVEKRLEQTAQRLTRLDNERKQLEQDIEDLRHQEAQLAKDLENTLTRIAAVLRNQYRRNSINPTQAWLAGQSASQAAREGYWFGLVSLAEQELGDTQKRQAKELEALREGLERKQNQLEDTIEQFQVAKRELASQKEERQQLIADLNSKLKDQEIEQKRLQRDEQRLTSVISQITKAIEEAKRRQAIEQQRQNKNTPSRKGKDSSLPPPPAQGNGEFAKLKGSLVLPTQGTIMGYFGKTRSKDGQGPAWRGLFIATAEGQAVRAVGKGRVVFSEWLRGFGALVILDHGDEYLSVYGNNGKLLKKTGDLVNAGETIAETGNSSGNLDTGLYFELRRQGQAFDPLSWTKGH